MFCANCGQKMADDAAYCPNCGAPARMRSSYPMEKPAAPMTRKAFWKNLDKKTRSYIITAAIACYISAGVTLLAIPFTGNFFAVLDVVIILALGLVIHLTRRVWPGAVLTAYGLYNCIYISFVMGTFGGWLPLLAGIDALIGAIGFRKAYKAHLQSIG